MLLEFPDAGYSVDSRLAIVVDDDRFESHFRSHGNKRVSCIRARYRNISPPAEEVTKAVTFKKVVTHHQYGTIQEHFHPDFSQPSFFLYLKQGLCHDGLTVFSKG
jgi:hypothetical protein